MGLTHKAPQNVALVAAAVKAVQPDAIAIEQPLQDLKVRLMDNA